MSVVLYKKDKSGKVETSKVDPAHLKDSLTDGWVLDKSGEQSKPKAKAKTKA